jgi:hypothetical protein
MTRPWLAALALSSCLSTAQADPKTHRPGTVRPARGGPVLLDARCPAQEWSGAARVEVGSGVSLLSQQDAHFVSLCLTLPAESLGTIDLYVLPEGASEPHNLHVSAQIGERQKTGGRWPDWTWGNNQGWASPVVPFRGLATEEGKPRLQWGSSEGREIQISRARFAGRHWRFMFELRALGPAREGQVVFPKGAVPDDTATWAVLELGG